MAGVRAAWAQLEVANRALAGTWPIVYWPWVNGLATENR